MHLRNNQAAWPENKFRNDLNITKQAKQITISERPNTGTIIVYYNFLKEDSVGIASP
jgi:hypothetical protein